jgi:hypothetical protein
MRGCLLFFFFLICHSFCIFDAQEKVGIIESPAYMLNA